MPAKAIMTFGKVKSKAMFKKMMKHNFREDYCENVNKSLSHLNEVVVPMKEGQTYKTAFEERIFESPYYRDHDIRKNAVLALDVLLTFSSKDIPEDLDLEEWKKANIEWLNQRFGKENVVSVVLHMDEKVPHMHAIVIPMHEQKLNCSHFVGGKESMREMQDSYAERMSEFGLRRGQKYSVAKHTDIQKFYGAVEEASVKSLPPPLPGETVEQYSERAQMAFRKSNLQHLYEVKELESKIATTIGRNIEETIADASLKKEHAELLKRNEELEAEIKVLRDKTMRLDEISYALRNNLPSPEAAQRFNEDMRSIAKEGRLQMMRDEQEKAEQSIANDVLNKAK